MKKDKATYSVFQNALYTLKLCNKQNKKLLIMIIIYTFCGVLVPFFGIYLPKIAIDELINNQSISHMIFTIGGYSLLFSLLFFVYRYSDHTRYWQTNILRISLLHQIFRKTLFCDYDIIESAKGQRSYNKAMDSLDGGDWSGISRILPAISGLVTGFLGFFLYSGLLSRLNLVIVLLLIISAVINYFTLKYTRNYEHEIETNIISPINQKLMYIENITYTQEGGKDIRLYNMHNWFIKYKNKLMSDLMTWYSKIANKKLISSLTNVMTILLRDGFAYIYLIIMVSRGSIGISEFVLYFGAIAGFSNWITELLNQSHTISRANLQISDMREFFEIDDKPELLDYKEIPKKDDGIKIEFKNVCFSYAENKNIINNLNLTINKGEKIALVGLNGAGKTTLMKLLCGFYSVKSGQILINDINIEKFRKDDMFDLFSAVFQDVLILPFTAAQNVSFCINEEIDRDKVKVCLDKAGMLKYFENLEDGIDVMMEKITSDKGIILSGGQKQKMLLARALYKDSPVLILDEPTAALDPIAESKLYEDYKELTEGKTAIYISHRLASTRFCDKIAYLSDGYIKELGSHEELLEKDMEYSNLFNVQSHYYKDNIAESKVM